MRMVDLIQKKRDNKKLTEKEINFIIDGYVDDCIPDYQMSAFMMAVCFNGLDKEETAWLTKAMMNSGDIIDLSDIKGIKADKHSTGGVGDKTTLVLGPMVSACGVPFAIMSGRGLGHTGGTLDKLESIPHFRVDLTKEEFVEQANDINIAIIGQTGDLVPADKKMYALRDVTATVSCIPLIASSIMSKKCAGGSDTILLDVKYGEGAFMKNLDEARELAHTMIDIGTSLNKDTRALISNMDQPLGLAVGNSLEIQEVIEALKGNGPEDLMELCLIAGSHMLIQAKVTDDLDKARTMLEDTIESGAALKQFKAMVKAQGGDVSYVDHPDKFASTKEVISIKAQSSGYVKKVHALTLGNIAMELGGGRSTLDDVVDHSVGLVLNKKVSDYCHQGDTLVTVYTNSGLDIEMYNRIFNAFELTDEAVEKSEIVSEVIK